MDVLQYLKADHEAIRTALEQLGRAEAVKLRRTQLDELAKQIQIHLVLERDYLYPEIAGLFVGAEAQIDAGLAQAAVIVKRLKSLQKIVETSATAQDGWVKRFQELRDAVHKHFDNEEQLLLPKLRIAIRTEDREDLGQVFLDAQTDVLTSLDSAPSAPSASRKRA